MSIAYTAAALKIPKNIAIPAQITMNDSATITSIAILLILFA